MSIDWITVTAQIINFLILVWLLKRFLYQPVMRAVAQREQRITDQLNQAIIREQKAEEQAQYYQTQINEIQQQREVLINQAKQEAEQNKQQMLEEARNEIAHMRTQWQLQVAQEKKEFYNQLRHHTAQAVQLIAKKALADLATRDLEAQIIQSFINRLQTLDQESLNMLGSLSEPVRIVTTFRLDVTARERIKQAIDKYFTQASSIEFSESPKLLCGIECTIGGQRLGWHLADYLAQLHEQIEKAFATTGPTGT